MADINLNQARQSLKNLKGDLSDVDQEVFIEWCNFANRQFYNFINGIDPERFIFDQTYSVFVDPQKEPLPGDFMHIQPIECGFYELGSDGRDTDRKLSITSFGQRIPGFYIEGDNVVFTGINDGTSYVLRYIPILATLASMTDTMSLDEIYLEALRNDLDRLYSQWDEDTGMESIAGFRFVNTLEELGNTISKMPSVYAIPDIANNF